MCPFNSNNRDSTSDLTQVLVFWRALASNPPVNLWTTLAQSRPTTRWRQPGRLQTQENEALFFPTAETNRKYIEHFPIKPKLKKKVDTNQTIYQHLGILQCLFCGIQVWIDVTCGKSARCLRYRLALQSDAENNMTASCIMILTNTLLQTIPPHLTSKISSKYLFVHINV